jgi:peptide/nickel transport system ATP-binding protein
MYRGTIVESGSVESVLKSPQHPYTKGLINCIPRLGDVRDRLNTIELSD